MTSEKGTRSSFSIVPRGIHARDLLMRIDRALADAWEMLERVHHPCLLVAIGRLSRKERDRLRIAGEGSGIPRADVCDRREVQIDTDRPE